MKRTRIIGVAIAALGLAACGPTVAPAVSRTLESTAPPSLAANDAPAFGPTGTPTPESPAPPSAPPILTALCAPNPRELAWRVSFGEPESSYNVDLSFNAGATFTMEEKSATQPYTFDTPDASQYTLILVRWDSYPAAGVSNGTNADPEPCNPALITPPFVLPVCRPSRSLYSWQASNTADIQLVNWNIDFRTSVSGDWTFVSAGDSGGVEFNTLSSAGKTLYVRWDWYPNGGTTTAQADTQICP
jgi:hypothetical protein